ncbi:helix-turn-helix domain-containing protein [Spongiibacter taiwanensis]|uniref:Crp/Fnr family transcriptional regulator n=1 Tax=Spongiibacter taiwanensis TaxID=1748242 RepID=UPI002036067E|nr:helix-turn-helix domain-containing protein [Spongiibacter taiwanensis]USA44473.1 helix-turn-helix domain-containing protein [Spongiibacter taiwanensis]
MSGRLNIDTSRPKGGLAGAGSSSVGNCSSCVHRFSCLPKPLVDGPYLPIFESAIIAEHSIKEGDVLFSHGTPFRSVYVVKSGSLKSTYGESSAVSGFFFSGAVLGIDGFTSGHYSGDLIALESSRVCEVYFEKLLELSVRFPDLQRHVFHLLSEHVAEVLRMNSVMRSGSVEQRTAAFLIGISDLYNKQRLSRSDVVLPMSRPDISQFLGVSPESLSRALSALGKKRLIKVFNRRVSFVDIDALRDFCQP